MLNAQISLTCEGLDDAPIVQAMRKVLVEDDVRAWQELNIPLGSDITVNRLLLTLCSPILLRPNHITADQLLDHTCNVSRDALCKVRDLVELGHADFSDSAQATYWETLQILEKLNMPECFDACHRVAGSCRTLRGYVQLTDVHNEILATRLLDLYEQYPRSVPAGVFDMHFVGPTSSTVVQAHTLVLVAVSSYFLGLARQHRDTPWKISVSDLNTDVLAAVLKFLYAGRTSISSEWFTELAFQADGWQLRSLCRACAREALGNRKLAEMLLEGNSAMPDILFLAAAYGNPSAAISSAEMFVRFLHHPVIASHLSQKLSLDRYAGIKFPVILQDIDRLFIDIEDFVGYRKGYGRRASWMTHQAGQHVVVEKGEDHIGPCMEEFLLSGPLSDFFSHPESLKLPAYSVAMMVESFFVGIERDPALTNVALRDSKPLLISWMVRWANKQDDLTDHPLLDGICMCNPISSLLHVRLSAWGPQDTESGPKARWHGFWTDLFIEVLKGSSDAAFLLVNSMEHHMQEGARINDLTPRPGEYCHAYLSRYMPPWRKGGKGKGKSQRELRGREIQAKLRQGELPSHSLEDEQTKRTLQFRWHAINDVYDAARVFSAQYAFSPETRCSYPWTSMTALNLISLVATKSQINVPPKELQEVFNIWLTNDPAQRQARACEFCAMLACVDNLLRFPMKSRKSPGYIRNVLEPADVVRRVALAFDVTDVARPGVLPSRLVSSIQEFASSRTSEQEGFVGKRLRSES